MSRKSVGKSEFEEWLVRKWGIAPSTAAVYDYAIRAFLAVGGPPKDVNEVRNRLEHPKVSTYRMARTAYARFAQWRNSLGESWPVLLEERTLTAASRKAGAADPEFYAFLRGVLDVFPAPRFDTLARLTWSSLEGWPRMAPGKPFRVLAGSRPLLPGSVVLPWLRHVMLKLGRAPYPHEPLWGAQVTPKFLEIEAGNALGTAPVSLEEVERLIRLTEAEERAQQEEAERKARAEQEAIERARAEEQARREQAAREIARIGAERYALHGQGLYRRFVPSTPEGVDVPLLARINPEEIVEIPLPQAEELSSGWADLLGDGSDLVVQ